jgi:Ca-activated chloride channel family protein
MPAAALFLLALAGSAPAHGFLIPEEKTVPPLAMLNHKVVIAVEDQIAMTKVTQTFRNHTDRQLEATYIFPLPKGASLDDLTMTVDGKDVKGEVVEAAKAREIYTGYVRRTQDPALLEYMGNNLAKLRVFPIPAHGDVKVALGFKSVAPGENGVVEYVYPIKTDGKSTATLEEFSVTATIKSQHGVANVYSPTHNINLKRNSDKEVVVTFDKNQALLDKDFQLFYALGDKDVGLTVLTHRPIAGEDGYFTMLISPKLEAEKKYEVPRDMVLVLDTSGSMRGVKMEQARKAMKYCLDNLGPKDRFAMINFATTVNKYRDNLLDAGADQVAEAKKWAEKLQANGGTAIDPALKAALSYRTKDEGRAFTVVFFTDGTPTIGETNNDKILANVKAANTANTRIFTFGVGDDVNATFLDKLADDTRAVCTYVRPAEDIEAKVSGLYAKISNPVLTDLKLEATNGIAVNIERYPTELPDLFHGTQLVVMGRYSGKGPSAIKLTGQVGTDTQTFAYDVTFPEKTNDEHNFVEALWARRKVGFLLDQIRANGEKPELVSEVTALAKRYGITTPYTSWLIVPDAAVPVAGRMPVGKDGKPDVSFNGGFRGGFGGGYGGVGLPALKPTAPGAAPVPVDEFARQNQAKAGGADESRGKLADSELSKAKDKDKDGKGGDHKALSEAAEKKEAYDLARDALKRRDAEGVQSGKLGVDLSCQTANLRNQCRLEQTALKNVYGRNCLEIGGVWIDEGFDAKTTTLTVKAQSDAYFKLLEKQPKLKEVFLLGNHLVWMAPNGTALVIDASNGKETLTDDEVEKLFVAKK